jgi:hypothetical protein
VAGEGRRLEVLEVRRLCLRWRRRRPWEEEEDDDDAQQQPAMMAAALPALSLCLFLWICLCPLKKYIVLGVLIKFIIIFFQIIIKNINV